MDPYLNPWEATMTKFYLATYQHGGSDKTTGQVFTALGVDRSHANRVMRNLLQVHAAEHKLKRNWFDPMGIEVTPMAVGAGYRDGIELSATIP